MEDVFKGLANYGFPIVVSVYLLVRMEAKLDELTKVITKLSEAISKEK